MRIKSCLCAPSGNGIGNRDGYIVISGNGIGNRDGYIVTSGNGIGDRHIVTWCRAKDIVTLSIYIRNFTYEYILSSMLSANRILLSI